MGLKLKIKCNLNEISYFEEHTQDYDLRVSCYYVCNQLS